MDRGEVHFVMRDRPLRPRSHDDLTKLKQTGELAFTTQERVGRYQVTRDIYYEMDFVR